MSASPEISIVVPLYNEVDSLPHLKAALDAVIERGKISAEIIFIDDGSNDGGREMLDGFAAADNKIRVHHFRRNRGKSDALDIGFSLASGKYIITMDADLQDEPAEIPNLIRRLEEGYDLVSGWKKKRHDPLTKTIPSKLYNWVARMLSGIPLHDFNCGLKIYRREVLETIHVYGELHRFIPILVQAQGWSVSELPVKHNPRRWGTTKFGISRFLHGFLDLLSVLFLTRFTGRPMHLFGSFGLISVILGFTVLVFLTVGWFMGVPIGNRPLFFLGILLIIVGIQFFSIGLLGELISHMLALTHPKMSKRVEKGEKE